jgi:signal transduction histidine kinase
VSEPTARSDRDGMLIEAGMTLASELSLGAVLLRIVELAVEVTEARYGALGVLTPNGRQIEEFITVGVTPEERAAIGDPPTGHGILGLLIREPHPLRLSDIAADARSVGFPPNHPPMRSLLGLPVMAKGRVFGNIYLTEKQGAEAFDEEDQRALEVLAAQAGVAIDNARLYEETERAARELRRLEVFDERERIAKELHDGVIQSLFAVGMGLQSTVALAKDDQIAARLEGAVEEIDHAIRDLRNYIFGLRPGILADRQLDQALRDLGEEFAVKTNVVTVVTVDESVASELAPRAIDIVQITREALSNVGKHAGATTCRVALRRHPDGGAELLVDDDGVGFDPRDAQEGMGLRNLSERVESLGGKLTIESTAGRGMGTTILATIPI